MATFNAIGSHIIGNHLMILHFFTLIILISSSRQFPFQELTHLPENCFKWLQIFMYVKEVIFEVPRSKRCHKCPWNWRTKKKITENRQFLEEVCRILFYSFPFPSTQLMTLFYSLMPNSGLFLREKYGEILTYRNLT